MAGRIPQELIDDLLARTDIVELISRRVPLRKAGKDYQACCPFHDERTPSFTVSRDKQFYHCFGCGAHGTAISFLMEYDRLGFREAVEELAQQAGMELPVAAEQRGPDHAPLYAILEQATALYRRELHAHPAAEPARAYLAGRGLSAEIIERFGIGYAPPGWDFLLRLLGGTPETRRQLELAGLVAEQEGRRYDRFRDRILFPIRDRRGRVIGFGGRVLGDQKPKYLNSPETPLFHKGRELYGLHEALKVRGDLSRLVVVEGYMDVIALAQLGIPHAVATLGTATTAEHLKRLLATAPELLFCFDGDRAGREAAWKALQALLPQLSGRQQVRFLFLPEGEDPDTLIRREGRDSFERRLTQAAPLSDVFFEHLAGEVDLGSTEGRARLAWVAQPLLAQVPAGPYKQLLEQRLAALVGIPLQRGSGPVPSRRRPARSEARTTLTPMRRTIALLVQHPHLATDALTLPDDWRRLPGRGAALLAALIEDLARSPASTTAILLERWRGSEAEPHLARLSDPGLVAHIPADGLAAELCGAIESLNRRVRDQEAERLFACASPSQWSEADKERLRRTLARKQ